jgi:hypothetical protein
VPLGQVALARDQEAEALVQLRQHLHGREHLGTGSRQLDGERNAFQAVH